MKKKLMMIGMIAFLIIASCITVYAGAHSVTLESKTQVRVGETFTVKLKVVTPDGINGMVTSYSYDTQKLELVSKRILDSNFTNLGGSSANDLVLMFNPENLSDFTKVTETNIYEFTFKVKDGATVGSTATINVGETELSTLATSNSQHKIPGDELTITILEKEQEPDDGTQTPGDGTQTPGDGTQTPGDGTQTPDDGTQTPDDGTQTPDDDTVADGDINYAGLEDYAFVLIIVGIMVAVVLYKKTSKMSDIK